MNALLKPDAFFDLCDYRHASIFEECQFVWEALNKIAGYIKTKKLGNIECNVPEGVFLKNPELISIGKGTIIEPCSYISGPCWIGDNCTIRHGAYIRGNLITGNDCVIGHDTEVKNCIMLNHTQAAHFAYIGDSILGNHVNLGAGTKCANLKLDHSSVKISFEGEVLNTNLRKLGAILGDNTQLGCNTVTNPGTLTGRGVLAYPGMNFGGYIPSNSTVSPSIKPRIKKRT